MTSPRDEKVYLAAHHFPFIPHSNDDDLCWLYFRNSDSPRNPSNMNTNKSKTNYVPSKRVRMNDNDDRHGNSSGHGSSSSHHTRYYGESSSSSSSSNLYREKSLSPKIQGFKEASHWRSCPRPGLIEPCLDQLSF